MCDSVNVVLDYPPFINTQYIYLNRRQNDGPTDSAGATFTGGATAPLEVAATQTTTTTLRHGDAPYTSYTSGEFNAATVTEIVGVPDSGILETSRITSTLPTGASAFTSTFINPDAQAETIVVGVSATKTTSGKSASTNSKHTLSPGGLSSGTKIGIGVSVPLVVLALLSIGIFLFMRRQKQRKLAGPNSGIPEEQEKDDGGLPENVNSIPELPKHPSYVGLAAGPNSIHELTANETNTHEPRAAEIQGTPRHEIDESAEPRRELSASPALPHAAIARKPVSPSAVPAPWEDQGYEAYQNPMSEPVRTVEDLEIQRLEEEMAQIKLRKERLQSLQLLEEREEELKKEIEQKRKKGGPSTP